MMMALGSFVFELRSASCQQVRKSYEYRWSNVDVVSGNTVLQSIGIGSEKIDLEGVIYPNFAKYATQITEMKLLAESQKPQLLVDGKGQIHGNYVIKQIDETQSFLDKYGTPQKIEFKISLEKYGEVYDFL